MTTRLRAAPSTTKAPAQTPEQEPAKRLVVETNRRTAADLAWLAEEEELNKTTLVNRAVQVYRMIIEAQRNGGAVLIEDPTKGTTERLRFV
jgi:hypothetical protein